MKTTRILFLVLALLFIASSARPSQVTVIPTPTWTVGKRDISWAKVDFKSITPHITELLQPACEQEIEGDWRTGTWTPEYQAEFIEQIYRECFGHPSVVSINYWGLSDRNIWMPGAGLIDAEYRPKPAFKMLKDLIKGGWTAVPFTARTDENGEINFRGFYGKYDVTQLLPGRKYTTWEFHLSEKQENTSTFVANLSN